MFCSSSQWSSSQWSSSNQPPLSVPSQRRHRLFWCTLLTHPRPPDDYQLHNGVDKDDDDDSGDDGDGDDKDVGL